MTKRNPAVSAKRPFRVEKRPSPDQWDDDELLTFDEAASRLWPDGPLTATSLRTAARNALLDVAEIAGKILTTKAALKRMSSCRPRIPQVADDVRSRQAVAPGSVAEMRRRYLERFESQ
jgi:hypothetical protein